MSAFRLAKGLDLPPDAATQTFAILGIRGSGKTNTGVVLAEELLKAGQQVAILDPVDVWWGLKSSKNGKSAGFAVPVLGGEHGDVPLESGSGSVVADFVVDTHASVIMSLRHLSMDEQRKFATAFAKRLYDRKAADKSPIQLLVDEADAFVPQRIPHGHEAMFGAFDRLVRRGRSSGIGVTLISQRAQVINKDVLSQAETLIAMRVLHKNDRKAMEAWIEAHDAEGRRDEFMGSLASLGRGDAWVWSPSWLGTFQRVHIRERETYDSSATPAAGGPQFSAPKKLAAVDLNQLKTAMAETIERAKADDPRALRLRIAELERAAKTPVAATPPVDTSALREKAYQEGYKAGLHSEHNRMWTIVTQLNSSIERELKSLASKCKEGTDEADDMLHTQSPARPPVGNVRTVPPSGSSAPAPPVRKQQGNDANGSIGSGPMRLLKAIAQRHPLRVSKTQLATLAGLSARGGTFNTYLSRLRTSGYMVEQGGYFSVSTEGLAAAGSVPESPRTTAELVAMWRGNVGSGAGRMLDILVSKYPKSLSREELAEYCKMAHNGGTFNTYLSRLRSNNLAEVRGSEVRASETLFDFGGAA